MKRIFIAIAIICLFIVEIKGQENDNQNPPTSISFHYQDIENFRQVLEIAAQKGDTLQAIHEYFEKGSLGMKAWIQRYNVNPKTIHAVIRYFPGYYAYLASLEPVLRSYEQEITEGLNNLKDLYPSEFVHIPPVYYFILFSGGGSVEMTANMISVDYFGMHDQLDRSEFDRIGGLFPEGKLSLIPIDQVPQVAIHETVHLLQSYMQGEHDYVSIYTDPDKQTILAYAIREGSADFLTYLAAGILDAEKWSYTGSHERELWEDMEPILYDNVDDHPGWFSGKSEENPNWPFQIGYHMGFKIVQYYYENSKDKKAALKHILNSHTEADFQAYIDLYQEKWEN